MNKNKLSNIVGYAIIKAEKLSDKDLKEHRNELEVALSGERADLKEMEIYKNNKCQKHRSEGK